jgi:Glycosyl hydrolase family 76
MKTRSTPVKHVRARRVSLGLVVCLAIVLFTSVTESSRSDTVRHRSGPLTGTPPSGHQESTVSFAEAAKNGVDQLIGLGGPSPASQDPHDGLWGGHTLPNWWQSALALLTLVRYLERTDNASPVYQRAIMLLYAHNHVRPNTHAPLNFANEFNDDTGWWGVAWLEAARYELYVRADRDSAAKFLAVAEWDANFINNQKRRCGGIEWGMGKPPDTITTAEYMSLTAGLSWFRDQPGPFHSGAMAQKWLQAAEGSLSYMETTSLINTSLGRVNDSLFQHSSGACTPYGRPITYTQGEVAEALLQLGLAMHQPTYFKDARRFIDYAIGSEAGLLRHGVLREHCEDVHYNCNKSASRLDYPAYKGLLVNAIADYDTVTGTDTYAAFLRRQATAVVNHALIGAAHGKCHTADNCFFGFYWTPPPHLVSWAVGVTVGGQESGIDALTSALPSRAALKF